MIRYACVIVCTISVALAYVFNLDGGEPGRGSTNNSQSRKHGFLSGIDFFADLPTHEYSFLVQIMVPQLGKEDADFEEQCEHYAADIAKDIPKYQGTSIRLLSGMTVFSADYKDYKNEANVAMVNVGLQRPAGYEHDIAFSYVRKEDKGQMAKCTTVSTVLLGADEQASSQQVVIVKRHYKLVNDRWIRMSAEAHTVP